ncbi:MAG: EAL domain-containing protein [Pseudorhodoplanes sp.]|nr:MAG: EAL domain-containing protein [Pseudorhodoplanes sp.]
MKAWPAPGADAMAPEASCQTGTAAAAAPAQGRLRQTLREHDARSERTMAAAQAAISCFVLALHLLAQIGNPWQSFNPWVVCALGALVASSAIRWQLSKREALPDRLLDLLSVADILIFLGLIWSYQFAHQHPASGVLKAPSFVLLTVLVALRALRYHPRPVLVAGITAVTGWLAILLIAAFADGGGGITRSYAEYLVSYKILFGAEIEKTVGLIALTMVLAGAAYQARHILSQAAHARDYAEALESARGNLDDATEAKERAEYALARLAERDAELSEQNERFNVALENMSQGLCMFDGDRRLVVCNDRYVEIYGLPRDLAKPGTPFRDIIEYRLRTGIFAGDDPQAYLQERLDAIAEGVPSTKIHNLTNKRVIAIAHRPMSNGGWVATHEDITELQRVQEQIAHMAHHDALTDLPNRLLLNERIKALVPRARRNKSFAVLCLDLDRFKNINDTLGHSVGDELLKAVAVRLRACVRETDTVARLGGDEFAIIQVADNQPRDVTVLARRICEVLRRPLTLAEHQVVIDTSIGIAIAPHDGLDATQLLKNADMALYRAKGDGRGVFRFFEAEMDARMRERRRLELSLRAGLERQEFELRYQPLVNIESNEISGFEALLRWNHPERGMVSPAEFIPIAEETGLIVPLGEWVVRTACAQAAQWPAHTKIAVNLSPVQFRSEDLVPSVFRALASAGLAPGRLGLEITEAVLLNHAKSTLEVLNRLREFGVRIAMDDFGTGYSSLSYLRAFPFDKIKIDRSFVSDLAEQQGTGAIIDAVAGLSRSLGIATTAEGVETQAQLERVREAGYTEMQGFLFSPPRTAEEITALYFAEQPARRIA